MQGGNAAPVAASQAVAEKGRDKAAWARYTGSHDKLSGAGHAAAVDASSSGILIGADASVSPDTRLGAMAGFSNGSVKVQDLRSHAKVDTYTLGAYGATAAAGLDFRYGATYSWHAVSSRRDTGALGGAKGRYAARTGQLFGEAAAPYEFGAVTVEPYAGLAYLATRRGRFSESGTAGLRADGATQQLGFSTLGLRAGAGWQAHDGSQWSLHGGAGWRHAYGGIQPGARMRFAGGDTFEVTGVPVARNALLIEAGIGAETPDGMRFGVGYSGQLARGAVSHAINAKATWVF
jgi:subtilase-type serine protease